MVPERASVFLIFRGFTFHVRNCVVGESQKEYLVKRYVPKIQTQGLIGGLFIFEN